VLRLSAFTDKPLRAGKRKLVLIALFGLMLAAQALLIAHSIEHAGIGGSADCALCLAADHQSGPATVIVLSFAPSSPEVIEPRLVEAPPVVTRLPYRSRAPPLSLPT
jgi:hypothetical protein